MLCLILSFVYAFGKVLKDLDDILYANNGTIAFFYTGEGLQSSHLTRTIQLLTEMSYGTQSFSGEGHRESHFAHFLCRTAFVSHALKA